MSHNSAQDNQRFEELFPDLADVNPVTREKHRREVRWQIFFPAGVAVLLFIAVVVLTILLPAAGASLWADISTIFLSSILCLLFFVFTAVMAGVLYVLFSLHDRLPYYTRMVQRYAELVNERTRAASDLAAEPVLKTHSTLASARKLRDRLFGRNKR